MNDWIAIESWARALAEFTRRNAGRRTVLEEDGLEIGAQQAEHDQVLRGVAFDPRDGRVDIMLGEQASLEHLTRSVDHPREIGILRDGMGRDRALRIGHDTGQTLLRLVEVK
jgi:hypothetical protein